MHSDKSRVEDLSDRNKKKQSIAQQWIQEQGSDKSTHGKAIVIVADEQITPNSLRIQHCMHSNGDANRQNITSDMSKNNAQPSHGDKGRTQADRT
ncbi:hypothetical protein PoB_003163600 [Plakobranchus ocellatus]|uniref:Uncharacterized protein n=1 Tax=Plakobranchus ocellatus TaxID=259542 RepID=A0AAV4AEQ4_9GAST|nr:hypothetical protein PoB_003163600 [Plakobranchus ocellatus]